ncbi:MAG: VOC family protein [Oceanicoccus sp.]
MFSFKIFCGLIFLVQATYTVAAETVPHTSAHIITAPKVIVDDLKLSEDYYKTFYGMQAHSTIDDYVDEFEETLLVDVNGTQLALYKVVPSVEMPLKKSQHPVVLFNTENLKEITGPLEAAGFAVRYFGEEEGDDLYIAFTKDPAGNVVEIISKNIGSTVISGSKLNVENRQQAEDFYARVFSVVPLMYFEKKGDYDEVLMDFGTGPFLALFESKTEAPLAKSKFPVVAITTTDYNAVIARLKLEGLPTKELEPGKLILANDPSGNVIEIIRR